MFNNKFGLETAVLTGQKTMTRRLATKSKDRFVLGPLASDPSRFALYNALSVEVKSAYQIGEVVAIRQSYETIYRWMKSLDSSPFSGIDFITQYKETEGWENKMFVNPGVMPFGIKITGIRAERLQDISDDDIMCEGITHSILPVCNLHTGEKGDYTFPRIVSRGNEVTVKHVVYSNPREAFAALIDAVSGRGYWEKNYWHFVYEFELRFCNIYYQRFYELMKEKK